MTTADLTFAPRTAGKLGRTEAKRLDALPYLHELVELPPAPASADVSAGITNWGMLGNDQYGNCTFAGETHYEMATAAAGGLPIPAVSAAQEIAWYLAYTHGQDTGANESDLLLAWYKAGKILAFAKVDHTNPAACDAAMVAFHGLYVGVTLTDDDQQAFGDHRIWSSTSPNPQDGHCIVKVKSDATTDTWVTWGALQPSTKGWTKACLDEAWVIITQEDADAAGLDVAQLRAYIDALGGTGGAPAPTPAPVVVPPAPVPAPTPPVPAPPTPAPPAPKPHHHRRHHPRWFIESLAARVQRYF